MLEYLGKDGKDVRFINRAILNGKIIERGCMYILANEYIDELEKEIKNLKETTAEVDKNVIVDKNDNQSDELKDHIRYLYYRNKARKDGIDMFIQLYYLKNQEKGWDYAVEKVYSMIGFTEDPNEEDELRYIKSIVPIMD